jgi:hypothetical protein
MTLAQSGICAAAGTWNRTSRNSMLGRANGMGASLAIHPQHKADDMGKICWLCECDHEKTGPCPVSQEQERPTVYLREVDAGTDNACWVVCNKVDEGAVAFAPII